MENEELNGYTPARPESSYFNRPDPLDVSAHSQSVPVATPAEQPVAAPAAQPEPTPVAPAAPAAYTEPAPAAYTTAPIAPPPAPQAYAPSPNRYTPEPPTKKMKKEKKGVGVLGVIAIALVCSLLGGALGAFGYGYYAEHFVNEQTSNDSNKIDETSDPDTVNTLQGLREQAEINITEIDTSKELTPAEVYAKNVNSTVGITTSITTTNFWGFQSTSAASGSGFIYSDDGYIITNHHVIENSNSITVSLYDGTEYEAELVGYDESNDLAVLKVDAEGLTPVILGDSDKLNVGDPVVAIGNPLGELTFSLTAGAVSAKGRSVTMSNGVTMELIQTDCAINSGNSGGALFNLYGEVVGITNAKYSSNIFGASIDNIGFAIPLNNVSEIIESIIEKGYISKPYIGVSVDDVSEESQSYGLPAGAAVRMIAEDRPAEEAGLQEGDIITHIDGTAISSSQELVDTIGDCEVGQELTLTIYRKNETKDVKITVGEQTRAAKTED